MMADIKALASITKEIESRIREFNSLVKKGGLRRKLTLQKAHSSFSGSGTTIWSTFGVTIASTGYECAYNAHVWGSVRWRPKQGKEIELRGLADFNKAAAIVLDLQLPDPSTVWELIPFSWLVDYFVNVGPALQALEGSQLVEPYDICIMRHRKAHTCTRLKRGTETSASAIKTTSGTDGNVTQEHKTRKVMSVPTGYTSLLRWSFITPGQALNITALVAALRGRRY